MELEHKAGCSRRPTSQARCGEPHATPPSQPQRRLIIWRGRSLEEPTETQDISVDLESRSEGWGGVEDYSAGERQQSNRNTAG